MQSFITDIDIKTTQELFNLISIVTKTLKILIRNKTRNKSFWHLVRSRESLVIEITQRRNK